MKSARRQAAFIESRTTEIPAIAARRSVSVTGPGREHAVTANATEISITLIVIVEYLVGAV
jgi:hypothetical protein